MSKIGVFDSGLGGFSIAKAIHQQYPKQDIVFLADQINVPYGNKDVNSLEHIVYNNLRWFYDQGVKDIILACNTTSVLSLKRITDEFKDINITRIIKLTVDQLASDMPSEIIVLATKVTIQAHAYSQAIKLMNPNAIIHEIAMPNLAQLIEDLADEKRVYQDFDIYLSNFKGKAIPFLMGCTHYPLVETQLKEYLAAKAYDSIKPILAMNQLYTTGDGIFECYTTDQPHKFDLKVKQLFKQTINSKHANIDDDAC